MLTPKRESNAQLAKVHQSIERELRKFYPHFKQIKVKRIYRDERVIVVAKDEFKRRIIAQGNHYNIVINFIMADANRYLKHLNYVSNE